MTLDEIAQELGITRQAVAEIIARNIKKERETEEQGIADNSVADAALIVVKQRHGDFQGSFKLWFDVKTQQFKEDTFEQSKQYLEV